ncbi:hypothetical protein DMH18_26520 [Streptomyces sp. WAC 06783]|uniref:hypothetical protein n=1 Tax=Streptomyces sp. WAC 06783 TaxID=2203211 RepID=UPI000F74886F|nr:hypothetical protein [Streptomyces sp. WAC 06783]RSO07000.1 hypothetical protein DMH18_26520 [Streptomyces sp. WAC 06783]
MLSKNALFYEKGDYSGKGRACEPGAGTFCYSAHYENIARGLQPRLGRQQNLQQRQRCLISTTSVPVDTFLSSYE